VTPPPNVGEEFVVTLHIEYTPPIVMWMTRVQWNPSIISLVKVKEGPFLSDIGTTAFLYRPPNLTEINMEGKISEMTAIILGYATASGTGDLAYLTFRLEKVGGTKVDIYDSYLLDTEGNFVSHSAVDGMINPHLIPQPKPPKADFAPPTCARYRLSPDTSLVTVKFNASLSQIGWDLLPENHSCPITEYRWDFDGDAVFDLVGPSETAQILEWNYTEPRDISVTLEVYAPDPTPPTDADYKNSSRVTHTIHILPPLLGPNIDVYTNKGGLDQGIDPNTGELYPYPIAWSDAFAPQEEVKVYALATYSQEPLEGMLVTLEVKDSADQMRVSRTAITNSSGIAEMTFRMPWLDSNGESLFGNWTITGRVNIAGSVVEDICRFRFGYLVSINVTVVNSPVPRGGTLNITIDMQTISFSSQEVYITIILYDELDVPVGSAADSLTVEAEKGATRNYEIEVQDTAFVGVGTAYVNAFTQLGGTAYRPELSKTFIISG